MNYYSQFSVFIFIVKPNPVHIREIHSYVCLKCQFCKVTSEFLSVVNCGFLLSDGVVKQALPAGEN